MDIIRAVNRFNYAVSVAIAFRHDSEVLDIELDNIELSLAIISKVEYLTEA